MFFGSRTFKVYLQSQNLKMKNNSLSIVALLGVVVLFVLHFSSGNNTDVEPIENEVAQTSDSIETNVQIIDTSNIEDLPAASYSKVGYCDIVQVITDCPYLAKKFNDTKSRIEGLQKKEYQIKKELYDYQQAKTEELQNLDKQGLLLPQRYEMEQRTLMEKGQVADNELKAMQPTLEAIQRQEAKNGEERDLIIKEALEVVNEQVQLDFVLVNNGTMTNVYHFSKKNHITQEVINVINKKYK